MVTLNEAVESAMLGQMEQSVAELLPFLDADSERDGLRETPRRVAQALFELTAGQDVDTSAILGDGFDEPCDEMVVVKDLAFVSLCEHHLMPFYGHVTVAYIPVGRVIGLSKFARLVDALARRLQIQERLTAQIADAIDEAVHPEGVGVTVSAFHSCMAFRGIRNGGTTVTDALRGALRHKAAARAEFMALAH